MRRRDFCRLAGPGSLSASLLGGCSPADLLNAFVPSGGYQLAADRPYGPGPRQRADLYLPAARAAAMPVVVFFYGGNWRTGDRADYRFVGEALTSRGIAAVIPDYRLYPDVTFPAFLEDCAAAIAWTRRNAREFGIDPQRLYLMGHSAGAYNGAMLTVDERWLGAVGVDARRDIRGFIGLAGPYDFLPFGDDTRPVFAAAGDPRETQPVTFVNGGEPPMLLMTGLDDGTVRPRNTFSLAERVRASGGQAIVKTYPDTGHVGIVTALAAPLRSSDLPVLGDVAAFVGG